MASTEKRPCGHEWRNNDFDCFDCLNTRLRRYESALQQVLEGQFRYNIGDYEVCAKNTARLALGNEFDSPSDAEQLVELRRVAEEARKWFRWYKSSHANPAPAPISSTVILQMLEAALHPKQPGKETQGNAKLQD